jgi:hypothetical protein
MKGETRERWDKLCQLAAEEQNPEELMRLVTEINRLLEQKEKRLMAQQGQSNEAKNEPTLVLCKLRLARNRGFS